MPGNACGTIRDAEVRTWLGACEASVFPTVLSRYMKIFGTFYVYLCVKRLLFQKLSRDVWNVGSNESPSGLQKCLNSRELLCLSLDDSWFCLGPTLVLLSGITPDGLGGHVECQDQTWDGLMQDHIYTILKENFLPASHFSMTCGNRKWIKTAVFGGRARQVWLCSISALPGTLGQEEESASNMLSIETHETNWVQWL